ncbi:8-amino-7-oxononanoate synthase [Methylococcus capsulatus str. Bath]|jgi:8-amino-7-oxononanoate synthase|uniref:8-amino-7-oxononanoate synthase n=1 Tax=Methylococcus capsulatus (strain ATCC 33009 / NCIMB 11132 / Bath) TaxID=243233 RepID=BIOF_METCA|nr:8-amino-7-oxononanoate synthase [Methylococcus capsulatus]Q609V1.1 RecName: Full=8-amino-7-oxononanoate synthase; Short=AONS; AltName: Full=7-keto-8-amino-pelargonic acid synthase; Short=7-KAP synthase; Short=KAPA synthase; AltName: Full=8-amino-7-ketopelargonate synthase [Methylococcus capsulatus str. Bath]AAU92556.1 8-amino-7-oxononanoate synthase [Methylococcus capsulatus str. Bath]
MTFDPASALAEIKARDAYRWRRIVESPQDTRVVIDGAPRVNFCSNDYLGLANHPAVREAFRRGVDRWGVGSGASHLVCGHSAAHHALEEELAEFTGRPRALLFSTGYMANLGVVSALAGRGDTVFEDRLNHASLLDGGLLSGARFRRYRHADARALEAALAESRAETRLVVTDGVFSMDGDLAPLPELARVARDGRAWLMVDDAHGLGVLGAEGRGTLEHFGLGAPEVPVLVGTLGKALGTFGAFVAGSESLIDYLIQRARTYVYTTALPPAVAEATRVSLRLVREEPERRERLRCNVRRFRAGAASLGFGLGDLPGPIQPLVIGANADALEASRRLGERGFLVSAIRPPTVQAGTARLRITLSAAHSNEQIDGLLEALADAVPQEA